MAPFVSTAAALLALLVLLCSIVMAATQVAGKERPPPTYGPAAAAAGGATPVHPGLPQLGQKVKMDVFLGVGCEKSARAWPILKRAASDQRNSVDFVFHILPLSDDPIVYSAAKAAQVLLAHAGETSDGVEGFVDLIFLGQEAIHGDQQGMDLTVDEARDIIGDWPLSFSSIPADVFHSAMRDPLFDPIVLGDLGNIFTAAVSGTPSVVLNGNFIMLLCGDRGLRDFQMFLEHFQIEDSGSGIRGGGGGSAVFGLDDKWGSTWPMWQKMDQEIGDAYQDMLAEQQQQQEKLREKEEAGEGCGTVREGLRSPTSSRPSPPWLSSSFEYFASSWSTSHEPIPPAVTKDQAGGAGGGDGGWDVEATTSSSSASAGHADVPPSKSLSPWSSVSESWSSYEASLFEALDERAALSEEAAAAAAAAWRATGGGSRLEEEEGEEEEEQGRSFRGEESSVFTGSHDAGSEGGGGGGGDGSPPEDVFAWFEAEERLGAGTEGPGSGGAGGIREDVVTEGSVSKAEGRGGGGGGDGGRCGNLGRGPRGIFFQRYMDFGPI
ncbi:unnamed protein product [Ectocarpus sp. 6 AP-2014]